VSWPAWAEARSTTITVVVFVLRVSCIRVRVDQICLRLIDRTSNSPALERGDSVVRFASTLHGGAVRWVCEHKPSLWLQNA